MLTEEDRIKFEEIFKTGGNTDNAVEKAIELALASNKASPNDIFFYETSKPYGWACNFFKANQYKNGFVYATNEHYYQSEKASKEELKVWIASCPSPFHAMRAGRALRASKGETYKNWDEIKYQVMLDGCRAKFFQNPNLASQLLDTGNKIIHEASPVDMVWGVLGQDLLGKVLMEIRSMLLKRIGKQSLETIMQEEIKKELNFEE
jgi:ribA/ribD-fused uncharacterized protein